MQIITAILAVLKAIPVLDKWASEFFIAYGKWKLSNHDKNFKQGLQDMLSGDQRSTEDAAGMNPGPNPDQDEIITRPRKK